MAIEIKTIKKILVIIIFIAAIIGIGYLLYLVFFKTSDPIDNTNIANVSPVNGYLNLAPNGNITLVNGLTNRLGLLNIPSEDVSDVAKGGVTKVDEIPDTYSIGSTIGKDGSLYYYDYLKKKFYRITPDGKIIPLSDKQFFDIDSITWSPNNDKAIIAYPDGLKILYNFNEDRQVTTLQRHWQDFSFSPSGDEIVFKSLGLEPENRWLAVASADGSSAKKINMLNPKEDTIRVNWSPNGQIIATYTDQLDAERQELYFIGKNDENFAYTIVSGAGLKTKWSQNGSKLLYSVYNRNSDYRPELWVVNASGDSIGTGRANLKINTWPDKCHFSSDTTLYCAVPEYLPQRSGVFPELAYGIPDNIYKIDLATGSTSLIAIPNGSYSIENIYTNNTNDYLYFTDAGLGKIHKIKLK